MPAARKQQISLQDTPYYHCVSRCVRRSFLCGEDKHSGKSYEHRRQWVEDRLLTLGSVFAIDVCAYAVMSNHTHVVLHVNQYKAENWSIEEVLSRWHQLHNGTLLTQQYMNETLRPTMSAQMIECVHSTAEIYRQRLFDISWFMRNLNEFIAREANKEDKCTGRFWEGRFKSQALLDEAALAACMAYVDLNPVRAEMADTPELSEHTSIKLRCAHLTKNKDNPEAVAQPPALAPFVGDVRKNMPQGLPFDLIDYIQLVELTGRCIREDKTGFIQSSQPNILTRLNIKPDSWMKLTQGFEIHFSNAAGTEASLTRFATSKGRRRNGIKQARLLLSTA